MSEPFKIRVGSKSNKGTLKSENDDRILIGMDPAANDWLFSPDPVQVGEFGTVLLLADGIGDNQNGGFAANAICKTIKKLFDETLELPPSDDEKLRLLVKFFQIAQKQLQTHSLEHPAHKNIGASATLVLLLENKAFIVWLGNCRAYRFSSKGVGKSYLSDLTHLELLTVEHTFETEKDLFEDFREDKYFYPAGVSKYVSTEINSSEISVTLVSLKKNDRILLCSEGLFSSLSNEQIQEILSTPEDPEIIADVLISRAYNNGTVKNISAVVADILEIESGIPIIPNTEITDKDKARSLYGAPVANIIIPTTAAEIASTPSKKDKSNTADEDLVPVKLRTVMPEPEIDTAENDQDEEIAETPHKALQTGTQISLEWPVDNPTEHLENVAEEEIEEVSEEDLIDEEPETEEPIDERIEVSEEPEHADKLTIIPIVTTNIPETPPAQIQGEMAERLARLKIKMTVYPDPEDKKQENDQLIPPDSNVSNFQEEDKTLPENPHDDDNIALESSDKVEEQDTIPYPSEDPFYEGIILHDDEDDEEILSPDELETPMEIPEPFESAILPLSEEFIIDLDDDLGTDDESSREGDDYSDEFQPKIENPKGEEEEEEEEAEEEQDIIESYEEQVIELEPVIYAADVSTNQLDSEAKVSEPAHHGSSVQKPIAHLIATEHEDKNEISSEKKSKLWPYFVVLGLLILIPIWICRDNSAISSDNTGEGASASISAADENRDNPSTEVIPLDTLTETEPAVGSEPEPEINEEEEAEIVNPPATMVPDPDSEKPKEKKKEETKPKSDTRQPKYDAEVEKNKHQLLGEVQALLQQKNQLCKQISTYGKNAPESKSESIKQIQNKCDQLGQKFSSIYDQKSGYFKTVRYDFMKGTIKSIRVSMDQIDQQFKTIREE